MTKRTRIEWTSEEWQKVAAATLAVRLAHPQAAFSKVLECAQVNALPEERRRRFLQPESITRIVSLMQDEKDKLLNAKPPTEVYLEIPGEVSCDTSLLSDSVAIQVGLERLIRVIMTATRAEVKPGKVGQVKLSPTMTLTDTTIVKPALPRIAVIGFLKNQYDEVEKACASRDVKLVFVDSDVSHKELKVACQWVILDQKHISHGWWSACKAVLPGTRIKSVQGTSEAIKAVYDIASIRGQI